MRIDCERRGAAGGAAGVINTVVCIFKKQINQRTTICFTPFHFKSRRSAGGAPGAASTVGVVGLTW